MDLNWAIEKNREALKRILAVLAAMAGLDAWGQSSFFPQKNALPQNMALAEKKRLSPALTLSRRLHNAVLLLLRPAEAAARRLVIVAARDLAVPPPCLQKPKPKPVAIEPILRSLGLAVVLSPAEIAARAAADRLASARLATCRSAPARIAFPLFDPLPNPFRRRLRTVPPHDAPRILFFDRRPASLPLPPSPDDPLDATRLVLRFHALGRVLDDLPGQARRFARWRARCDASRVAGRDAAGAQGKNPHAPDINLSVQDRARFRRIWPLKPGCPPGCRLSRYDPDTFRDAAGAQRRNRHVREVDEVLAHAHAMALYALERRDTS